MIESFKNQIILENCLDFIKKLDDSSIDLVITSPPYKKKDGLDINLMNYIPGELYRVLKPNHLCFINFGHLSRDKMAPFRIATTFRHAGFDLVDTIIWKKNHFTPIRGNKHLNNLTEFIFLFSKGTDYYLDRLSIGVPYKDPSNAKRWKSNKGQNLRCRGNLWEINYETIQSKEQKLHPDRFPLELPLNCIKLSGIREGIVLDPFVGSGTTCLAAKRMRLNYLGVEKNKMYHQVALRRIGKIL